MFRELDQRHSDGITITLEWDGATGEVWVRCEDRHSPEEGFSYSVAPGRARLAFLHPFALRPSTQAPGRPARDLENAPGESTKRRRRWLRQRTEADTVEPPSDSTWMWRSPEAGGMAPPGCE
jgi:hypothetical protein